MSTRMDIELTSQRPDGTWTWRKSGAKLPKGEVADSLLPAGAKTGDILRVEAEVAIDGTEILAVVPQRTEKAKSSTLLEVVGRPQRSEELVTTKLAGKGKRRDRSEHGDRSERPRRDRMDRPRRERAERPRREAPPQRPRPKRLKPLRTHRSAILGELSPETRRIAEEVLRGGIPAVRDAIDRQNELNTRDGLPAINKDELVALAEQLLPRLRTAEWRDRAEAALASIEELDLRDLRSVVVAADGGARDDETRAMAQQLQEALTRRVESEHALWLDELTQTLQQGRIVRALRLSSRPPKPGTPLPGAITERLVSLTLENLTLETAQERWAMVIDAVAFSPIRNSIEIERVPEEPTPDLIAAVSKVASRVPSIAALFGVSAKTKRPRRTPPPEAPSPAAKAERPSAPAEDASTEGAQETPPDAAVEEVEGPSPAEAAAEAVADVETPSSAEAIPADEAPPETEELSHEAATTPAGELSEPSDN